MQNAYHKIIESVIYVIQKRMREQSAFNKYTKTQDTDVTYM